jgi:sialate O-acetylesterase
MHSILSVKVFISPDILLMRYTNKIRMKKVFYSVLLLAGLVVCGSTGIAQIRLPSIIGSHMVLEQQAEVNLWGWCNPGENITINPEWDTITYQVTGSSGASWKIKIKTPAAGGPYRIRISGYNQIILEDVMIGEVWLCGGQSNMQANGMPGVLQIKQSVEAAPLATNTRIRFFYVPLSTSTNPQDDIAAKWVVCSPGEMLHFSSVGYFFGKQIDSVLQLPIGLINTNWGGTPAESWTPADLVEKDSLLESAAGQLKPAEKWPVKAGVAYNAMIYPLIQFSITGAIWYQGESNALTYSSYSYLFNTMIGAWRKAWEKDFPFYYVQIAPYAYGNKNIRSLLCEQQTKSLSYPGTGMVIISDLVDDVNNIHPQNKKEVGTRLANVALAETYGKKDLPHIFPQYQDFSVEKDRIIINIYNPGSSLISKNGEPAEFYIAAEDKKFVPASVRIKGNQITVWSKEIKNPVAVRFGFGNTAMPNIFNREGLPLNLFRTDNWTVDTGVVN